MPSSYSPLRYPGGKAKLGSFLAEVFTANRLVDGVYAEPYAGGAGAGLHLLFRGYATRFLLNDIDHGVVAFWRAVLNQNEKFARRIEKVSLTVKEWDRQKRTYEADYRGFDLGFAFFYLNRTNRSGIMNGGIIGGREQTGPWKIDARFNREDLAARIRAIAKFRRAITVSRLDASQFLTSIAASNRAGRVMTYLDPPYFGKGHELYTNYYTSTDHIEIAKQVQAFRLPWMLTYDDCPEIRKLYRRCRVYESEVTYSARDVSRGREVVIFGPHVKLPTVLPRPKRGHDPGFELLL